MKKMHMIVIAVLMSIAAFAGNWTLTSDTELTENVDSGNPWVLTVNVQNTSEICITKVLSAGDSTELDFSSAVKDSGGAEYSIVEMGGFKGQTTISKVVLPNGLLRLGYEAFRGCTSLKTVTPFLPDSIERIGNKSFYGCSSLEGELNLTGTKTVICEAGSLSDNVASQINNSTFNSTKITRAKLLAPITTLISSTLYPNTFPPALFYGASKLESVEIGSWVERVGNNGFISTVLKDIVFHGDCPTFDVGSLRAPTGFRMYFPRFDEGWKEMLESAGMTPINETIKNEYLRKYPGETFLPLGKVTLGNGTFYVSDIAPMERENGVHVAASIPEVNVTGNEVSPSFGFFANFLNGEEQIFTAPANITKDSGTFKCVGHVLSYEQTPGGRDFTPPVTNASLQCSITQQDNRIWRLIWLWEAAYGLSTDVNDKNFGSITLSPEGAGSYASGTLVTLTVNPNPGCKFVRWYGDVPKGKEVDRSITLTMDTFKSVKAYFSKPWTYDEESLTITDGNWVLDIVEDSFNSGGFMIKGVKSVQDPTIIDLSQIVDNSRSIVEIGKEAFKASDIQFVFLGNQIKHIGIRAFYNCQNLEWVYPLLPSSLVKFGQGAFSTCTALEGDVVFPENQIDVSIPSVSSTTGYDGWFYNTKITSCDMSKAMMTEIVKDSFRGCSSLQQVKLPKGIESLGDYAFYYATKLTKVEPFLPNTITFIGYQIFAYCSKLEGDLEIIGANPVVMKPTSNSNAQPGPFAQSNIKCAKLLAPIISYNEAEPGTLPSGIFMNCANLRSVELGKWAKKINVACFWYCSGLKDITLYGTMPEFTSSSLQSAASNIRFHVSKGSSEWQQFYLREVTPMNDTLITEYTKLYPGEDLPKGQFLLLSKKMWFCPDFGLSGLYLFFK